MNSIRERAMALEPPGRNSQSRSISGVGRNGGRETGYIETDRTVVAII